MEAENRPTFILRNNEEEAVKRDYIIQETEVIGSRERFVCKICGKKAAANKTIRVHLETNHNKVQPPRTPHECKICGFTNGSLTQISNHMNENHSIIIAACDMCQYRSTSKHSLRDHIKTVHMKIRAKCDLCPFDARRQNDVRNHKLTKHEGFRFNCQFCSFQVLSKEAIKYHVRMIHMKVFCNLCDQICTGEKHLMEHKREIHEGIFHNKKKKRFYDNKTKTDIIDPLKKDVKTEPYTDEIEPGEIVKQYQPQIMCRAKS